MIVRPVCEQDIEAVVAALSSAFQSDPLITFLFGRDWSAQPHAAEFFRILLDVRVGLGMPAFCAEDRGIVGAVMGYDSTRPAWSEHHTARWERLMGAVEGLESRLEAYAQLADRFAPAEPHAYLGVIGVCGGKKGSGVGRLLLERFCACAAADSASAGVYLETASEASLRFYLKHGFEIRGEGVLGADTSLWCVFKASGDAADRVR